MVYYLLVILIWGMVVLVVKVQILLIVFVMLIEEYVVVEFQWYYYQLFGCLLFIDYEEVLDRKMEFVLIRLDYLLVKFWRDKGVLFLKFMLGEQGYVIWIVKEKGRELVVIVGVDVNGLFYGVYGLLEDYLGMCFYMNGDVYFDKKEVQMRILLI